MSSYRYRIAKTDGGSFEIVHEVLGPQMVKFESTEAGVLDFFEQKSRGVSGDDSAAWVKLKAKVEHELERIKRNVASDDESVGLVEVG